ncbi:MAG: TetR/AcrR family transcriptional regulator [Methyloligellaceae bacterium]
MSTKKQDTRTAILMEAQDMIERLSISGVSFQDIANKVGIKKGSMYYHFESKDDLSVGMLNLTSEKMTEIFERGLQLPPEVRLKNLLSFYKTRLCEAGKICAGGIYASHWDNLNGPVKDAAKGVIAALHDGIKGVLEDGIKAGVFNDHGQTVDDLAGWITASIQGALVTSRVQESTASFESIEKVISNYLLAKPA